MPPETIIDGKCHCGDIAVRLVLTKDPGSYEIRACDCSFCRMHGVAYVSDPEGQLGFDVSAPDSLGRYRQGAELADMLFCRRCGGLVGAVYETSQTILGVANARLFGVGFGPEVTVSPRTLEPGAKADRWQQIWFRDVQITDAATGGRCA